MSLDIGIGAVRKTGEVFYRDIEPEADWLVYDTLSELLERLRNENGTINVTVSEGLMSESFRFTVFNMPWEGSDD